MFCRKCGTQNEEEARFCWKCGEPLPNDVTAGEPGGSVEQEERSGREDPAGQGERYGQGGRQDVNGQGNPAGSRDGFSRGPAPGRQGGNGQGQAGGQGGRYSQGGPTGRQGGNSQGPAPGQRGGNSQGPAPGPRGGNSQNPASGRRDGNSQGSAPGQGGRYSQGGPTGQRGGNGYGPAPGPRNRYDQGPAQGRRDRFEPEAGAKAEDEEKARIRKRLIAAICTVGVLLLICIGTGVFFLANGNSAQAEKKFQEKIVSGNKYVDELDYDSAIDAYQNAIEIEPKKTEGYEKLADVYMQQKEYEKAEATLIKGIQTIKGSTVLQGKLDEVYEYIEPSDPELVLPTEAPPKETQAQAEQQQVTQEVQTEEKTQQGTEGTPVAGETQQGTEQPQTAEETQQETEQPQTADETQLGTEQPQTADETQQGTDASETTAETQTEVQGSENETESETETAAAETGSEAAGEEPVQVTLTEDEMRAAYQKFIEDSLASGIKLANTDEISYIWGGNAVPPVDEYGGLVSAYVSDLDEDGILEMLTVSYTKTENGLGDKMPGMVVELYTIENGAVADKGIVCKSLEAGSLNRFEEIVKVFVKDVSGKKYICFYGSAMATMLANGPQLTYSIWTYDNKEIKNECDFNFFYNRSDFPADVKEKLDSLGLAQGVGEILAGENLVMITELHALAEGTDQAGAEVPAYAQFTDYTDLKKMLGQPQGEGQTEPESSTEVNTEVPAGEGQNDTEAVSETATGTEEGPADIAADGETQAETEQIQAELPAAEQTEAITEEQPAANAQDSVVYESIAFGQLQEADGRIYSSYLSTNEGVQRVGDTVRTYFAVYGGWLYLMQPSGQGAQAVAIERVSWDGSERAVIVEGASNLVMPYIINGWLYYAPDSGGGYSDIVRMNLENTQEAETLAGMGRVRGVDSDYIYYTGAEGILRARPDGSDALVIGIPEAQSIRLSGNKIYYSDENGIAWIDKAGGEPVRVADGGSVTDFFVADQTLLFIRDGKTFAQMLPDDGTLQESIEYPVFPQGMQAGRFIGRAGEYVYLTASVDGTYIQEHPEIVDPQTNRAVCRTALSGNVNEIVEYYIERE